MFPISVVIITFNEERNIARCLDSVKEVSDEVVVIDSYSKDSTEAICIEKGVRFIQNTWPGYGAQKNFGNKIASHDWILSLDADEALSPELKDAIMAFMGNPTADACYMNRMTNYCGHWIRHCGWYPDRKIRLFRKSKVSWNLELVHEDLVMEPDTVIGFLKGDIQHYSFYTREDHLQQVENYSSLVARQFFEKGKKASWLKMIFSGPVRFIRDYFFRLGFLDGGAGFTVCYLSAKAARLKYYKLRKHYKNG